jgi:hypothetical protein
MIRKLLVIATALAIPVGTMALTGGVAGAKTVVPPDPSQNCSIAATVNFGSHGLSTVGQATTDTSTTTTISGETLNCTDGNGHSGGSATINTALNITSKTTKCATAVAAAGGLPTPTSYSTASDPSAESDANAKAVSDASHDNVPTGCIVVTSKAKKGVTTYTIVVAKEYIAGSLGGFAGSASASLGKALKSLDVTVTDSALTDSPISYVTKTTSTTFPASGCTGSDVGFGATGAVKGPSNDKGQTDGLTACLSTVTGLPGFQGAIVNGSTHFIDVLDGSVAGTIGTAQINGADSAFTITQAS